MGYTGDATGRKAGEDLRRCTMQRMKVILIVLVTFTLLALVIHQTSAGNYNRAAAVNYADNWELPQLWKRLRLQ